MTGPYSDIFADETISASGIGSNQIDWADLLALTDVFIQPRRLSRADELAGQVNQLLRTLRIAVIYGGDKSREGAVLYETQDQRAWESYRTSAEDIAESLARLGCPHVVLIPDDMRLAERLNEESIQFAWLNTGGVQGQSAISHAPSILEMLGVPYVGHDPLTAGILDSKHTLKRQLQGFGLPTANFMTWHASKGPLKPRESFEFLTTFGGLDGPFIVKSVSGAANFPTIYSDNVDELPDIVDKIFELTGTHVLIEDYLGGPEYRIAACGPVVARHGTFERLDESFCFAAVERLPGTKDRHLNSEARIRPLDPEIDGRVLSELQALAQQVFEDLNLESLVQVNVRADINGAPVRPWRRPKA